MTTNHLEIEVKLESEMQLRSADVTAALDLGGRWQAGRPTTLQLAADYFDTADLRLARAGISLRRRVGGPDEGWHLKLVMGDDARHEVHLALSRGTRTVPAPLRRIVAGRTAGGDLVPVARIRTSRTTIAVLDEDRYVADVALDEVSGERLAVGGHQQRAAGWNELEVELVDGDRHDLQAIVAALDPLGTRPAAHASKLSRVLDVAPSRPGARWPTRHLRRSSPSMAVAMAYLNEQLDELVRADPLVRADAVESVHDMRVAVRRARSTLRNWQPVFDEGAAQSLATELGWLSDRLGVARDAEVLAERLAEDLAGDEADAAEHAVLRETQRVLAADRRRAHADLLADLAGARYAALVGELSSFVDDPPLRAAAHRAVRDVGLRRMARADQVVRARMALALAAPAGTERDLLLHRARKATKRARYAAESLEPVYGKAARRYTRAMERLQGRLGDLQDTVVLRQRLASLAGDAPGSSAFVLGRQHALDAARGQEAERAAERAWRRADDEALRAWFA